MFLFTTPPAAPESRGQSPVQTPVMDAIRAGSQRSGADFDYLLKTAQRESALDPQARAKSSSASGLFQFLEQTWLGVVKATGAEHGLAKVASAISETKGGRFEVADPAVKQQILALRADPEVAAVMAGELTRRNGASLAGSLGRQPTRGELYIAHVMGAAGGAELIRRANAQPGESAASVFPDAAQANRSIFYDKATGRPRSLGEVYANLSAGADQLAVPAIPPVRSDPSTWFGSSAPSALATAYAQQDGPALHGLFHTQGARGPINQAVQRLWGGTTARATTDAPRFFPRTASLPPASDPAPTPADVPLPPERPADLSAGPGRRASGKGPLDLTMLLKKKV